MTPSASAKSRSNFYRGTLPPAPKRASVSKKHDPSTPTLLAQSTKEGSADFIAELISGRHSNAHVYEYANPRAAKLWQEFKAKMLGKDFSGWYDSGPDGRPKDLGYWMGYKITEAFYRRASNKHEAVKQILEIPDFESFFQASENAKKFGQ